MGHSTIILAVAALLTTLPPKSAAMGVRKSCHLKARDDCTTSMMNPLKKSCKWCSDLMGVDDVDFRSFVAREARPKSPPEFSSDEWTEELETKWPLRRGCVKESRWEHVCKDEWNDLNDHAAQHQYVMAREAQARRNRADQMQRLNPGGGYAYGGGGAAAEAGGHGGLTAEEVAAGDAMMRQVDPEWRGGA
jgi:hypothetical protein